MNIYRFGSLLFPVIFFLCLILPSILHIFLFGFDFYFLFSFVVLLIFFSLSFIIIYFFSSLLSISNVEYAITFPKYQGLFIVFLFLLFSLFFVDFHKMGSVKTSSNIPGVEGVIELLIRYVIPVLLFKFIVVGFWSKKLILFIPILLISLYIDLYLKGSKQVAITLLFVVFVSLHYTNGLSLKKFILIGVFGIFSFAYVSFTRIEDISNFSSFNLAIDFLLNTVYLRTVSVPEAIYFFETFDYKLFDFKIIDYNGYSSANAYTNIVHDLPIFGGHSNAPGSLLFFLFNFGIFGGLIFWFMFLFLFVLFVKVCMTLNYNSFETLLCCELLGLLLFMDGIIDERFNFLFLLKFLFVISFFLYLNRFSLRKKNVCNL